MYILGALIYKKQLVVLDNANSKVTFLTFEKEPSLIKEIPIRDNGKRLFMINDTLIVQHSLKEYLLAEYDDNGTITSTYPALKEDDMNNIFDLSGDLFYDKNMFYLFKSNNLETISFKRKDKEYSFSKKLINFNDYTASKMPQISENKSSGAKVYSPPTSEYLYTYQIVKDKLIVQNIEKKKGAERVMDVYEWNSLKYRYSFKISPELNKRVTIFFFYNNNDRFIARSLFDHSVMKVKYDIE